MEGSNKWAAFDIGQDKEISRLTLYHAGSNNEWTPAPGKINTAAYDLVGSQREDIKLNVEYGGRREVKTTIPDTVLDKVQGSESCKVAILEHEGDFRGKMQLKFPVEKKNAGKYANLYYYNESAGNLEFQESVKVDGDGMALFHLTHASQYVIHVGEEEVKPTPVPTTAPTAAPTAPKEEKKDTTVPVAPKTGDMSMTTPSSIPGVTAVLVGIVAVLVIFGAAAVLILSRKRFMHSWDDPEEE